MIFYSVHPYLPYLKLLVLIVFISLTIVILTKRKKQNLIILSDKKCEKIINLHKIPSNKFEVRMIDEIGTIKKNYKKLIYISSSRARLFRDLKIVQKYQERFNELYIVYFGKFPKNLVKNFKCPVFHLKKIKSFDF